MPGKKKRRVAIVGTAPSCRDAPYDLPDWEIWACSARNAHIPRFDRFYEIHGDRETADRRDRAHVQRLAEAPGKVWQFERWPELGETNLIDRAAIEARWPTYFLSSSIAWMIAHALIEGVDELGVWGVDMAHETEYAEQKPGCMYFLHEARRAGIVVHLPLESPLSIERPPYPDYHYMPLRYYIEKQLASDEQKAAEIDQHVARLMEQRRVLAGAIERQRQILQNWL